jgi:hypothetical protein
MSIFARIRGALWGERLAVLGDREAGKTHLQMYLRDGQIPDQYVATRTQYTVHSNFSQLVAFQSVPGLPQKVNIGLKKGYDVPGSPEAVASWRETLQSATIMLYLFRADLVFANEESHLKRVVEDARLIAEILRGRSYQLKASALIGTHYDLVAGYQGPEVGARFYRWHTAIESNPRIDEAKRIIRGGMRREPALVVGSMETITRTNELLFRLFTQELTLGAS